LVRWSAGTAGLSIALADTTVVEEWALKEERSGEGEIGSDGVSFIVEEIKVITGTFYETH